MSGIAGGAIADEPPEPSSRPSGRRLEFSELAPTDPLWAEVVSSAEHDIYHRPGYLALEARRAGYRAAAAYVSWGSGGLLVPYLVRPVEGADGVQDAASPYGYSGALLAGESDLPTREAAVARLWQGVRELGYCSVFLRMHPLLTAAHDGFGAAALQPTGEVVVIDLSRSDDELWQGVRKENRRVIRRSREAGMAVEIGSSTGAQLQELTDIYFETMRRVDATPFYFTFDHGYFSALGAELGDDLALSTTSLGSTLLSASLWSRAGGIVQALLGGTRTGALRMQPNVLETYEAMLWHREAGATVMNLGGGVGARRDSLFRFKQSFSPDTRAFFSVRMVLDEERYRSLTLERARALGAAADQLAATGFFPAYRASA